VLLGLLATDASIVTVTLMFVPHRSDGDILARAVGIVGYEDRGEKGRELRRHTNVRTSRGSSARDGRTSLAL